MKSYLNIALKGLLILFFPFLILFIGLFFDLFGKHQDAGIIQETRAPFYSTNIEAAADKKRILFGDLHVHTTYSLDAFLGNLPILEGEGTHPVADACNFARFCSSI